MIRQQKDCPSGVIGKFIRNMLTKIMAGSSRIGIVDEGKDDFARGRQP